jgi:DNA-3-methyladenine glycosylase II
MIPTYWQQATQALATEDEVLRQLINRFTEVSLNSRGDAFTTLARAIVGQQISVKAAETVWQKVTTTFPEINPITMHAADVTTLRACGLSLRKVSYIQDLSEHFLNKQLNETEWEQMDDETIIMQLVQIKGIGRWTAEMFLIFHLLRADVLPLDDIGLQRAISMHYNERQPIDKKFMRAISRAWQPWRSVATWYLWRSLDPLPVEY